MLSKRQYFSSFLNFAYMNAVLSQGDIRDIVDKNKKKGRLPCANLMSINLFAAVVLVTPPRITRRGDWMITAKIVDDSWATTPLVMNIFQKEQRKLPKLVWMGDIICIHRARVEVCSRS